MILALRMYLDNQTRKSCAKIKPDRPEEPQFTTTCQVGFLDSGIIWDPPETVWDYLWSIWDHLGLSLGISSEIIWDHLGSFGVIWCYIAL